jgi:ABC-2 type transport system ATP-binding protein
VDAVVERTGLRARAGQPARQLSAGWRRLTDLARALVHQPDLLILDEPTVGLDPEHRELVWRLLESERRERGTTILFSTHYLTEAERCDRVELLANGRSVGSDTPAALKASIGEEVIEIESLDAANLVDALRGLVNVRCAVKTERGYRIGIDGHREGLSRFSALLASGNVRFSIRQPTLDDVYFDRTQGDASTRETGVAERVPSRS